MISRAFVLKLTRFGLVGGLSTAIYVGLSAIGIHWALGSAELVNTVAYCCSGIWGYIGHYHITFQADTAHHTSVTKFIVLFWLGYAVASGIVLVNQLLGWSPLIGTIVSTIVLPVMNFIVMQIWVFARRAGAAASRAEGS